MELLNKLEEKIILALETIELLTMENDELKEEVSKLKLSNTELSDQKTNWESKVNNLLGQFDTVSNDATPIVNNTPPSAANG